MNGASSSRARSRSGLALSRRRSLSAAAAAAAHGAEGNVKTVVCGYALLLFTFVLFASSLYAVLISKLVPNTGHALFDAIRSASSPAHVSYRPDHVVQGRPLLLSADPAVSAALAARRLPQLARPQALPAQLEVVESTVPILL